MKLTTLSWVLITGITFVVAVFIGAAAGKWGHECEVTTDGPVWTETCTRDVSP